jgi:hypothetical protein
VRMCASQGMENSESNLVESMLSYSASAACSVN